MNSKHSSCPRGIAMDFITDAIMVREHIVALTRRIRTRVQPLGPTNDTEEADIALSGGTVGVLFPAEGGGLEEDFFELQLKKIAPRLLRHRKTAGCS